MNANRLLHQHQLRTHEHTKAVTHTRAHMHDTAYAPTNMVSVSSASEQPQTIRTGGSAGQHTAHATRTVATTCIVPAKESNSLLLASRMRCVRAIEALLAFLAVVCPRRNELMVPCAAALQPTDQAQRFGKPTPTRDTNDVTNNANKSGRRRQNEGKAVWVFAPAASRSIRRITQYCFVFATARSAESLVAYRRRPKLLVRCCREAYPLVASGEPDVPKYGDTGGDGAGGPAEAYPRCVDRGAGYEWLGYN